MSIYHYVYRITSIIEHRHYYGKRSSKICPKLDIGKIYFSSSSDKNFISDQKDNPQNYKYKVIRIFQTSREACLFESKLHYKFDVGKNPKFYNRAKQTANGFDTTGTTINKELRVRISNTMKQHVANGKVFTVEHRANLSIGSKGKQKSRKQIEKGLETKRNLGIGRGKNHPKSKYIYVTPWGEFDSPAALEPEFTMSKMKNMCLKNKKKMFPFVYNKCQKLKETFSESDINKTYKELGFYVKSSRFY